MLRAPERSLSPLPCSPPVTSPVKSLSTSSAMPLLSPPTPKSLPRPPEESKREIPFPKVSTPPRALLDPKRRTHGTNREQEEDLGL
jgi:hypothetical protein